MLKCPWGHLAHPTQETFFMFSSTSHSFPAIPEFHKKLSLLSFWTKCCSPVGVYHSSAYRVIKQLEVSFARTVNKEYPGLAEAGTGGSKKASSFPATWVVMGSSEKKNSHATGKRSTSPLDYKKIANVHYASSDFFLKYCIDYFFSCGDKTPDRNCS